MDLSCTRGTAQLAIGDGFFKLLCGCSEGTGPVVPSGKGQAVCTVPVGTVVFFYYMATINQHQLVPRNASNFPASSMSDPLSKTKVTVHAFKLTVVGSYDFEDAYDLGIAGKIIAQ